MRLNWLDRGDAVDSRVRRAPAGLKLGLAVALVVGVAAGPWSGWLFYGGVAGMLAAAAWASRLPAVFLLSRLLLLEPLVLGVALLAWFQPDGGRIALGMVIRSTLCLFAMVLFANTTPFSELLRVLRSIRVPGLLVTTVALLHRYLHVLLEEAERMRRARASRTFQARRSGWSTPAAVVGALFARSTERAERIYSAMCSRGWK